MKTLNLFIVLSAMSVFMGCGEGLGPMTQNQPQTGDGSDNVRWEYGETASFKIASGQARRTLETLGTDLGLDVNEFEDISINLELQTIVVSGRGSGQQYYEGDLSIGWTSHGEFQEIKARAETAMMQEATQGDCSWWSGCTVLFTESNEAKTHSFKKGAAIKLVFEILDDWADDYDLMGGAFIFYASQRGDDPKVMGSGSIHYLPPYCPKGGGYVDGRWYPCQPKSLHMHCWLLKSGPYQCQTVNKVGSSTYRVKHCGGKGAKWSKSKRQYECPSDRVVDRSYIRLGSFGKFSIKNAENNYYASIRHNSICLKRSGFRK